MEEVTMDRLEKIVIGAVIGATAYTMIQGPENADAFTRVVWALGGSGINWSLYELAREYKELMRGKTEQ